MTYIESLRNYIIAAYDIIYSNTMKRHRLFLLALYILTACSNNTATSQLSEKADTVNTDTSKSYSTEFPTDSDIKLDYFRSIPNTIDGCGEFFTYNTNEFGKDKFIFLSNITSFAIIKVEEKDIYLNIDKEESREINETSYISVYKGDGYKAILNITQTKAYDEGGFYSGTLQIIHGDKTVTFHVHGEAGC